MMKFETSAVPLYNTTPSGRIQVEEMESLLNLRYNIIHELEARIQNEKEQQAKSSSSLRYPFLTKFIESSESQIGWGKNLENDITSYFVLSLAFCKSEQDRLWLANLESKLFMGRLEYYQVDLEEVLRLLNIPLERQENIPEQFSDKIRFRERHFVPTGPHTSQIFRIPFEYALQFIPTMNYFLHKGFVYITKAEIFTLIETVFKENTVKKLSTISKNLDRILSDTRIKFLILNFQTRREVETLSKPYTHVQSANISHKDVDVLAEKAFPLCMQILHRSLTHESHLKHWGRLQYGLFLKGIGLSLDESLNFWKNKFARKTAGDKFEKEYSYNIRHSYGKEGKRSDYVPYSCNKNQGGLPPANAGEYHGCPFKTFSEDKLRHLLHEMKMKELDVLKILEKARNKEYSVACIRYFESKFPGGAYESVGIHPNNYFESANRIIDPNGKGLGGANKAQSFNARYAKKNNINYEQPQEG